MRWWIAAAAFAVALAGVTVGSGQQEPKTYGYLLFTPTGAEASGRSAIASDLRIEKCRSTPDGLEVQGHVTATEPPVQIGVTPDDPTGPGLRTGVAYATHAPLWEASTPGDFRVVIPWANEQSRFFVVVGWDGPARAELSPGAADRSVVCPEPA